MTLVKSSEQSVTLSVRRSGMVHVPCTHLLKRLFVTHVLWLLVGCPPQKTQEALGERPLRLKRQPTSYPAQIGQAMTHVPDPKSSIDEDLTLTSEVDRKSTR